jgi:hypothetical protein
MHLPWLLQPLIEPSEQPPETQTAVTPLSGEASRSAAGHYTGADAPDYRIQRAQQLTPAVHAAPNARLSVRETRRLPSPQG